MDTPPAVEGSPGSETYRTPHWVKVSAIVALVLIVAVVLVLVLTTDHGPGRHLTTPLLG